MSGTIIKQADGAVSAPTRRLSGREIASSRPYFPEPDLAHAAKVAAKQARAAAFKARIAKLR